MKRYWVVVLTAFSLLFPGRTAWGAGAELLETWSLFRNQDQTLTALLDSLELQADLIPQTGSYFLVASALDQAPVKVVPLSRWSDPPGTTYLFFQEDTRKVLFLGLGLDQDGQPEMALWSLGPAEILISGDRVGYLPNGSGRSFTLADQDRLELQGVTDQLSCLAASLGLSLDVNSYNSLSALLQTLLCGLDNALETLSAISTACNCLSTLSLGTGAVFGTLGCIQGLGKLMACGFLSCPGVNSCSSDSRSLDDTANEGPWSLSAGQTRLFCLDLSLLQGISRIKVHLDNMFGDPDLYTRNNGAMPSTSSYDCRPYKGRNQDEICYISSPNHGPNYMLVRAYSSCIFKITATPE